MERAQVREQSSSTVTSSALFAPSSLSSPWLFSFLAPRSSSSRFAPRMLLLIGGPTRLLRLDISVPSPSLGRGLRPRRGRSEFLIVAVVTIIDLASIPVWVPTPQMEVTANRIHQRLWAIVVYVNVMDGIHCLPSSMKRLPRQKRTVSGTDRLRLVSQQRVIGLVTCKYHAFFKNATANRTKP